jgi:hypothetical protein
MERDNEFEWRQFCKLGEMIGDGLHHEDPWISKEYKRLQKILLPETKEEKEYKNKVRKLKNENIDNQISERLKTDRCQCGSELKQIRSGSKKVKCVKCENRYKYGTKRA